MLAAPALALGQLSGSAQRIEGYDVSIEKLEWSIQQDSKGLTSLHAIAARATLAGMHTTLENLELRCDAVAVDIDHLACLGGELSMQYGVDGPRLGIDDLSVRRYVAGSQITMAGRLWMDQLEARFVLEIDADRVAIVFEQISASMPLLAQLWADDMPVTLQQGALQGQGRFSRDANGFALQLDYSIDNAAFDSPDGLLAGADLSADGRLQIESHGATTVFQLNAEFATGEFLADSLYLDFSQAPTLAVVLSGELDDHGDLVISSFEARDSDGLALAGSARIDLEDGSLTVLDLTQMELELDRVYGRYLEAVVSTMGQAGLLLAGTVTGQVKLRQSKIQSLDLLLDDVWVIDRGDRFGLEQLAGEIHVLESGQVEESRLQWQAAHVYQIDLGHAEVHFRARSNGLVLSQAIELEVLDGSLRVDDFGFSLGPDGLETFEFSGAIGPVSLNQLSEALGWPLMQGSLSGQIPKVSLNRGVVDVGGVIRFEVFDGTVTLGDMKMERLFGVLPTLAANITIDNLDLQQMTSVFSFGRIEGRLSGRVSDLRMLDWEPVAFDLDLYTDKRSRARRRISQRAVENLSNIGGGAAALSQTFLRVFDDFAYNKLGLRCRLRNNICTMGGVEAAATGYYILKGSGIPRIDILGYSTQVDWPQLLRRLDAATRSGGATVD